MAGTLSRGVTKTDKPALARYLVDIGVPVRPLAPGRKLPIKSEQGSVYTLTNPDTAAAWWEAYPRDNIGLCHAPIGGSRIVCVDVDVSEAPQEQHSAIVDHLRVLGVRRQARAWLQRTGRGNYQFLFAWRKAFPPPVKVTNAGGLHIDLLSNGYSVIAPSDTSQEPSKHPGQRGGGPYTWAYGHEPGEWWPDYTDVELGELKVGQPTPTSGKWRYCKRCNTQERVRVR